MGGIWDPVINSFVLLVQLLSGDAYCRGGIRCSFYLRKYKSEILIWDIGD